MVTNDYDLGRQGNWVHLFGKPLGSIEWMAPSLARRDGDGMHHKTVYTVVAEDGNHGK